MMFGAGGRSGRSSQSQPPSRSTSKNQPELRMRLVLLDVPRKKRTPFAGDAKAESEIIRVIGGGGVNFLRSIEARRSCVTIPSSVIDRPRPLYSRDNLGGETRISGAFVFQSLTLPPNNKTCRAFPQNRSIYHNSRCTYPLKNALSRFLAQKNAKRQGNTRAKPEKCVRITFRALHNYARKRFANSFDRSKGRTSQKK